MNASGPVPSTVIKAPRGRGELLLYLDFDGVLHHEEVYWTPRRGAYIKPEGHALFEHARLLEQVLAPYPTPRIVLSTSWVRAYSCAKSAKRLPPSLRSRVIGATFHSEMNEDAFATKARGIQVFEDVCRRRPRAWLALDDDDFNCPSWCRENLVHTHHELGISEPSVLAELREKLQLAHAAFDSPTERARSPSCYHGPLSPSAP
ncbi:HAD domain-containing protein [Variovorax sp. Sphag1AA]|uniref:HAD domain-containing protein n=1 Tax=Variovorax sp. Sphag1AA TaxID=2587027 RepID=UPI00160BB0DD|nr:HAD domain-containing protein [Variovorax sp. Sphag1AA]MBB3182275.1 hypothetical protein [Variovorax sp. Sphag1AA]